MPQIWPPARETVPERIANVSAPALTEHKTDKPARGNATKTTEQINNAVPVKTHDVRSSRDRTARTSVGLVNARDKTVRHNREGPANAKTNDVRQANVILAAAPSVREAATVRMSKDVVRPSVKTNAAPTVSGRPEGVRSRTVTATAPMWNAVELANVTQRDAAHVIATTGEGPNAPTGTG